MIRTWISSNRFPASVIAIVGVAVIGLGVYWFGPQNLFFDKMVNEALPGLDAAGSGEGFHLGQASKGGVDGQNGGNGSGNGTKADAAPAGPVVVEQGEFRSLAHGSSGTALIVQLPNGSTILRLEDLDTSNGPDLRVYLSRASAGGDPGALDDDFVDLGALKGNQGDQNYVIPGSVDPSGYRSAVVWCRRFAVGFAAAPLEPAS